MLQLVRDLVQEVQTIDSNIGAHFYPDKNLVTFWAHGVVLDKITLSEENFKQPNFIDFHKRKIVRAIRALNDMSKKDWQNIIKQSYGLKPGRQIK